MVYSLDCGGLYVGFSAVSAFIGSFNVNVNEVVVLQRINSRLCLAAVVCVKVARRALNFYNVAARADSDTLDEVDCGDDGAFQSPFFTERGESGLLSGTPEPGEFAGCFPLRTLSRFTG